jgi:F-type H+-transporting ATPase subunit gamma
MTERLADVSARIENVKQLGSVVTAIRGIAASRAQQSRNLLKGIAAYSEAISMAIGEALRLIGPTQSVDALGGGCAVVLFCAEQGFAGGLSDRMLEAVGSIASDAHLIVVGSRGGAIAVERGFAVRRTVAMAAQIGAVPDVANLIADTLYARIAAGTITRADILYPRVDSAHGVSIEHSALFPIELEQFRRPHAELRPLVSLKPERLIERLAAEYVYARLCEAAMHAFAAENQARMETMSAASTNIDRTLGELKQREDQVRQEEVTAEIVELAASAARQ